MRSHVAAAFATHFHTAQRLHEAGRLTEAIDAYQRAIDADANVPEAYHNLACAHLALGRIAEGAAAVQRAVELRPDFAEALDTRGVIAMLGGRTADALSWFGRAAALAPQHRTIALHLGDASIALHRYAQAEAAYATVLRRADDAVAHNGRGVALDHLGRTGEAADAFRAALAAQPDFGIAACNLGRMLLYLGDIDDAVASLERAVALEPDNAMFHRTLAIARGGEIDDQHLANLERLAGEAATLPHTTHIELEFALAGVYERRGRLDDAFRALASGNAAKRAIAAYDEPARMALFASLEALCTPELIAAMRGCGHPSARPVFIFGMPRSGTTLTEQILAAHPAVATGGELEAFETSINATLMAPETTIAALPERFRALADGYLRATDAQAGAAERFTDKLTQNFAYAPLIHVAFPNARLIHMRRDPLDTCFSCYATLFAGERLAYSYDLRELGRYYAAYERMMERWRALLPAERFLEVDYEHLVDDFETEARRIVAFCDLPWNESALAFHTVRRPVRTASTLQVRQPLYRGAIGRGRRFEAHLGPLIEELDRRRG